MLLSRALRPAAALICSLVPATTALAQGIPGPGAPATSGAAPPVESELGPQEEDAPEASAAESPGEGAGHGSLRIQVGLFEMDDPGEGNPFLDESLTVIEPVVIFDYNVTDRLTTSATLSYDYVSSASIDRLSNFPEQSGASRDNYLGLDLAFDYEATEQVDYGGHLGYSIEYDYMSIGFGGHVAVEGQDRNSSLSLSLDGFVDVVDIIRFDGTQDEGTDTRLSLSATASYYRVLGPRTHGELGWTVTTQSGFLETPYNAVVLEDPTLPPNGNLANNARGVETTEELPDSRLRSALFGRVRRSLRPGTAAELGGRLYADTWGIASLSVEPQLHQSLTEDWRLRLRYRYYVQSESKYFDDTFLLADPLDEYHTQDSDLASFDAHTVGLKFTWDLGSAQTLDLATDYVLRSDGLDQILAAVGWSWSF